MCLDSICEDSDMLLTLIDLAVHGLGWILWAGVVLTKPSDMWNYSIIKPFLIIVSAMWEYQ